MTDREKSTDASNAAIHDQHVGKGRTTTEKARSQQQLLAALTATDATIRRLNLMLSTAAGQERVLATVNYVASMLHHLCASAPWITFQTRLSLLARLKGRSQLSSQHVKSAPTGSKFAALSSLASETRYNLRLFGLLPLWIWGSETLKSPPADPIMHALTILQIISNVVYQLLENIAYLASKGVISKRFVEKYGSINRWYIWSTRGWFGHIFLQFFVLWREHVLRKRHMAAQCTASAASATSATIETKGEKAVDREELQAEIRAWRKSLVNNTIWAPLCIHWCFENGIGIPNYFHGPISFMAGAWSLYDLWAATAKA